MNSRQDTNRNHTVHSLIDDISDSLAGALLGSPLPDNRYPGANANCGQDRLGPRSDRISKNW